jgi:hypothetical protein
LCVGGVVACHSGRARRKREDAVAARGIIAAIAQQAEASAATQQYSIGARAPQPAWALPGPPGQHAALVVARVAAAQQAAARAEELAASLALQPGATSAIELTQAIQTAAAEALVGCAPAHLGARTNATLVTAANAAAASFAVVLMACYNTETAGRPAALMPPLPYASTAQLAAQLAAPPPNTRVLASTLSAPGGAWDGIGTAALL